MSKESLPELALSNLQLILDRDGEVIYSSHHTLKKGDIYLLGLNPGGAGFIKIREHLNGMLIREENSYLDESWGKGASPLQQRINWLLEKLGYNTWEVCASNLIFVTSKNAGLINFGLAGYCWNFHEHVLNIVQPETIICYGNSVLSPFMFIHEMYGIDGKNKVAIETFDYGDKIVKCKHFKCRIQGRETLIIGLPHLSRFEIIGKGALIEHIKRLMGAMNINN